MDSLVDEELVGWLNTEDSGQWLNVQMDINDKMCPSGAHIEISIV